MNVIAWQHFFNLEPKHCNRARRRECMRMPGQHTASMSPTARSIHQSMPLTSPDSPLQERTTVIRTSKTERDFGAVVLRPSAAVRAAACACLALCLLPCLPVCVFSTLDARSNLNIRHCAFTMSRERRLRPSEVDQFNSRSEPGRSVFGCSEMVLDSAPCC